MTLKQKLQKIVVHNNLVEFFKDLVRGALKNQNVDTDEMAEFYLVRLLADYHKMEKLRIRCPKTGQDEPLAITYLRALNLNKPEQINLLKGLGDHTLYLSGFFSEHLEKTIVGLKYYMAMGENAYYRISEALENNQNDVSELYLELGKNFCRFVDILSEVSEASRISKDTDLLRLYERWLETGSDRMARALVEAGIPLHKKEIDFIQ